MRATPCCSPSCCSGTPPTLTLTLALTITITLTPTLTLTLTLTLTPTLPLNLTLTRHDALASLDLSQCRMSETATMRVVRALAAGGGPSRLAELKLADNRLRVGPSPRPHPRPRPRLSPCPRPSRTSREPQP